MRPDTGRPGRKRCSHLGEGSVAGTKVVAGQVRSEQHPYIVSRSGSQD